MARRSSCPIAASAKRPSIIWTAKYGGLDISQLRRLKEFESENAQLKKMHAESSLTHYALQDAVEKSYGAGRAQRSCGDDGAGTWTVEPQGVPGKLISGIQRRFIQPGKPMQNGLIERCNRT